MKKLVIFGAGKIAEVISYYAINECGFEIAAYTVDREYINSESFNGIPVVPFDELTGKYPKEKYDVFVALGYHDMNKLREKKYLEVKTLGYNIVSIISPKTNLPSNVIYGENCFIMPPALIHPCVELGNNVFVFSGAMVGHHSKIGDNCWLTSCTNISGIVSVGKNCFFAVNSTVGHQVSIGDNCFLGANALATKCLKDNQVVIAESTPVFRLDTKNFLRITKFSIL